MANNFFKIKKGQNLDPVAGSTVTVKGDVAYNASTDKLELHNGAADPLVNEAKAATLTNKSIDAATNTLSNITNSEISASAAIVDTKLATIATAGKVSNSATTATDANTSSAIVARDASGNFSAGTVTAALTGTASGNTTITPANHAVVVSSATNSMATAAPTATTGIALVSNGSSADPSFSTVKEAGGGTNQTTYTTGDILYASASNTLSKLPVGTANQVIKQVNGLPAWAAAPTGGVNYLSANPDAESDTAGWTTYADAAQNTPVDGTGGSPSSTWTRTTSSPLRGTGSFLWTRSAANRQGEGVAYAFTIDNADQSRPLAISFDYKVASGTFVAADGITAPLNDGTTSQNAGMSDLEVFVYDVTNAVLVPVSPQVLTSTSAIDAQYKGTFQTASNSTSYRLIIHTARSTAVAFTMQMDNFFVGPQAVSYGAPVSDWTSFTMSILGSSSNPTKASSPTVDQAKWRRVGDSMQIMYNYQQTSATGAAAGSGAYLFALPSGYSIDSNKVFINGASGGIQSIGSGQAYDGTTIFQLEAQVFNSTSIALQTNEAAGNNIGSTRASLGGTNARFGFICTVPIVGWSSTTQMSNDTDTRVVAFSALGVPSNSISSTASTITWSAVNNDTHNAFSSGVYTVPVSGFYQLSFSARVDSTLAAINSVDVWFTRNNASDLSPPDGSIGYAIQQAGGAQNALGAVANGIRFFTAGDTIRCRIRAGGTSPTIDAVGATMSIFRLTGPAAIAATETVACKAHGSTTTVGTSLTTIVHPLIEYDSHSAYNTSTGQYTAPISGKYRVTMACLGPSLSWTTGSLFVASIFVNGVETAYASMVYAQTNYVGRIGATGSATIKCSAGDAILIKYQQVSSAAIDVTNSYRDFFEIERVGN